MSETLEQRVVAALRTTAQTYAAGDQGAPCAVLRVDSELVRNDIVRSLTDMRSALARTRATQANT